MLLRLKMYIRSYDTFLWLKIVRNGYCGNDKYFKYFCLGFRRHFFRHIEF